MTLKIPHCTRSARFWGIALLFWFIILNILSHGDRAVQALDFFGFDIPHLDKILHFGYFFGGGSLFAAALFFRSSPSPSPWLKIILIVTITLSIVGIWDEFHQSFFENRSGNDPGDWAADTLGALCGSLLFRALHRVLL